MTAHPSTQGTGDRGQGTDPHPVRSWRKNQGDWALRDAWNDEEMQCQS